MPKIIVSYRRSDSQAMAGRIYDRLSAHYGDESVFMDIDKIPVGTDFRQYIRDELRQADVLLAIIGPRWLGPRDDGRNRINDRADPVRVEIETALEGGIPVVPVLVDDARMPEEEELPDTLKDFVFINAASIDIGRDFRQHMDRLIRAMDAILVARVKAIQGEPRETESKQPEPTPAPAGSEDRSAPPQAFTPAPPVHEAAATPAVEQIRIAPKDMPLPPSEPISVASSAERPPVDRSQASASGLKPLHVALLVAVGVGGAGLATTAIFWRDAQPAKGVVSPPPTVPPPNTTPTSTPPRINTANIPPTTWKLQSAFPSSMQTALPRFTKRAGDLSDGRLRVDTLPAGAVVPAFQLIDAVHNGILDAGYGYGSVGYSKHKAFALMMALPFGFAPREQLAFRRRPEVKAVFDELVNDILKLNIAVMPCGGFGRSGELWLKRDLRQRSDLAGQKLRFVGVPAEIYKVVGSAVTVLPAGEIIPALERGLIDGLQYLNPKSDLDLGLARVLKHYYYPSLVMPSFALDLYVNKSKWDAISSDGRQVIESACREAADEMIAEQERLDQDALAEIKSRGVAVAPVPAAVERELYAASEKVLADFRRDPLFDKVMRIADQLRPGRIPVTQP